jgi:hypothetical protein
MCITTEYCVSLGTDSMTSECHGVLPVFWFFIDSLWFRIDIFKMYTLRDENDKSGIVCYIKGPTYFLNGWTDYTVCVVKKFII